MTRQELANKPMQLTAFGRTLIGKALGGFRSHGEPSGGLIKKSRDSRGSK